MALTSSSSAPATSAPPSACGWPSLGHDVLALRRNAALVPAPLVGRSVDLTREAPDLAGVRPRFVVVALTARPRTEEAYRATYVDGMARALDALEVAA